MNRDDDPVHPQFSDSDIHDEMMMRKYAAMRTIELHAKSMEVMDRAQTRGMRVLMYSSVVLAVCFLVIAYVSRPWWQSAVNVLCALAWLGAGGFYRKGLKLADRIRTARWPGRGL